MIDGLWMNSFGSSFDKDYLYLNPNRISTFSYHAMCVAAERGVKYYDMTGGGTYITNPKFWIRKNN